jgi:hypothetical protein
LRSGHLATPSKKQAFCTCFFPNTMNSSPSSLSTKHLGIIIGIALLIRLVFGLWWHPPGNYLYSDMANYWNRSQQIWFRKRDVWDAFIPLGYPFFLGTLTKIFGRHLVLVAISQALLGSLTVWLTIRIGELLHLSYRTLVGVGITLAGYPPLIYVGGLVLTETLFSCLLCLSLWRLLIAIQQPTSRQLFLAGTSLSVACVVRSNLLLIFPFLLIFSWSVVANNSHLGRAWVLRIIAYALPLLVLVSLLNTIASGRIAGLSTNGGANFFLAHAPVRAIVHETPGNRQHLAPAPNSIRYRKELRVPVPFYFNGYYYRAGFRLLANHPTRLLVAFENLREGLGFGKQSFWPDWPAYPRLVSWSFRAAAVLVVFPGLWWLLSLAFQRPWEHPERHGWWLLSLTVGSCLLTLYGLLGDPRIRLPFDPLLVLAASQTWARWLPALRSKLTNPKASTAA